MSAPVALVTGASRGIGRQLAISLAGAGYDVVCAARSSSGRPGKLPGTIEDTAKQVEAQGRRALAVPLDVRDEEAVAALAERLHQEWGRCDVLVNNAAVAPHKPALEDSTKRWRLAVDVNLNGPFYLIFHFAPRMAQAGGGRVVNISSGAAVMPEFGRASYTATKAALDALTRAVAHDLQGRVAVNSIRLELMVWTEGFAATLPGEQALEFEDPIIMSDALLWLVEQPISYSGNVITIAELREKGVVRSKTEAKAR
jgi:NAD(P)-dependent dehydrogenase (short-subunit alcohol dehydrogenase family)